MSNPSSPEPPIWIEGAALEEAVEAVFERMLTNQPSLAELDPETAQKREANIRNRARNMVRTVLAAYFEADDPRNLVRLAVEFGSARAARRAATTEAEASAADDRIRRAFNEFGAVSDDLNRRLNGGG